MSNSQKLGGTRQTSPLADEMSYPLTNDEFLLLKENLNTDKITNLESLFLSLAISSIISLCIFYTNCTMYKVETVNQIDRQVINNNTILILIIYGAVGLGSLIGFCISYFSKKKTKNVIDRLNSKIDGHLKIESK